MRPRENYCGRFPCGVYLFCVCQLLFVQNINNKQNSCTLQLPMQSLIRSILSQVYENLHLHRASAARRPDSTSQTLPESKCLQLITSSFLILLSTMIRASEESSASQLTQGQSGGWSSDLPLVRLRRAVAYGLQVRKISWE